MAGGSTGRRTAALDCQGKHGHNCYLLYTGGEGCYGAVVSLAGATTLLNWHSPSLHKLHTIIALYQSGMDAKHISVSTHKPLFNCSSHTVVNGYNTLPNIVHLMALQTHPSHSDDLNGSTQL